MRWNLELVNRWLIESRPPSESELEVFREHARARAAEGIPADVVPSFVVAAPRRSAEHHAELAAALRRRHALAASDRRRVIGLSNRRLDWDSLELDRRALIAHGSVVIGVERGHALDELCDAVDAAVARGDAGHVEVDDYLGELLLRRSPRAGARIEQRLYGPLGPELARTLDVLVEHNFERARSAAALPVHRNTLRDRIGRISELTGVDLESAGGRALAWLAWVARTNERA